MRIWIPLVLLLASPSSQAKPRRETAAIQPRKAIDRKLKEEMERQEDEATSRLYGRPLPGVTLASYNPPATSTPVTTALPASFTSFWQRASSGLAIFIGLVVAVLVASGLASFLPKSADR